MKFLVYILIVVLPLANGFAWDNFNIRRLFTNSETIFDELEHTNDEKQCIDEFRFFVDALKQGEAWATKVMDTWGKEPNGLHSAVSTDFGHFDQCIHLAANTLKTQLCQMKVENDRNVSYTLGVCVPTACQDKTVYKILKPFFANVDVTAVSASLCYNGEKPQFGFLQYIVLFICAVLILAAIVGTYQGLMGHKTVFRSFDLYQNTNRLFDHKSNFGPMNCLNGIRVISMFLIIFFHVFYDFCYHYAHYNPNDIQEFQMKSFLHAFIRHTDLAVDTFLLVSGLLMSYNFVKTQESGREFNIFKYYLHRYLRLIPTYVMVMLIMLAFGTYVSDGPQEHTLTGDFMTGSCKEYWWSGLLLLQNYINSEQVCVSSSWYISVDMQLYLLSPLVMFPLIKYGRRFYRILGIVIFVSIGYIFGFSYFHGMHFNTNLLEHGPIYYTTHVRIGQWLVGVTLGYYLYNTREDKRKLNKKINIFLWILSLLTLFMITYIPYTQYRDATTNVVGFAFYMSLHRFIWALAVAWIIFACVKGHGGPVNWLLSFPFFQPLMKLSYAVYMIHYPLDLQLASLQRSLWYFDLYLVIFSFLGLVTLSLLLAVPMVLLVEMPIPGLEAYIFKFFDKRNQQKMLQK